MLLAQEVPLEGLSTYGPLGILLGAAIWLLWWFVKQQRQDLVDARAELKAEREAHNATREQTAAMLAEATKAIDRMARRRER